MDTNGLDINQIENGFEANCFDIDIIDDPCHSKRFKHLKLVQVDAAQLAVNDLRHSRVWRECFFLSVALVASIVANAWFFNWAMPVKTVTSSKVLSVELKAQQEVVVEPSPEQMSLESPVDPVIETESELVVIESEFEAEPVDSVDDAKLLEQKPVENDFNFRDQIESVVKTYHLNHVTAVVVSEKDGLTAPGVVFDNALRETLDLPWLEKLNQRRAPADDQPLESAQATGFYIDVADTRLSKIGDSCYSITATDIASNTPNIPIMGNGWDVQSIRKVKCSISEPIRRSDLNTADLIQ